MTPERLDAEALHRAARASDHSLILQLHALGVPMDAQVDDRTVLCRPGLSHATDLLPLSHTG